MRTWIGMTLVALCSAAAPALAQQYGPPRGNDYGYEQRYSYAPPARHDPRDIDARLWRQRERIEHGLRTGAITRGEARRLFAEHRDIRERERWYLADGVLTRSEYTDLERRLNLASRGIYNEARDGDRRYW